VVEFLNAGKARNGSSFKPLSIGIDKADLDPMAQAKQAIKDAVKDALDISLDDANIRKGPKLEDLSKILTPLFQGFIDTLPAGSDVEKASYYANQIAEYIVYDKVNEMWSPVNVISASLGQGDTQISLLQMANSIATIANGGTRYRTSLVDRVLDEEGNVILENQPEVLEETGISEATLEAVRNSMRAVNELGGTAYSTFRNFPIATAGKTGTASVRSNDSTFIGRSAYGVYVTYAPADDPEIAIAIVIYDSTRGSYVAPIALAMYEEYFKDVLESEYPGYTRKYNYKIDDPYEAVTGDYDGNPIEDETTVSP